MSDLGFRAGNRNARRAFVVGMTAVSVLLAGCGGTRVSDEAIERAAGVRQDIPASGSAADAFGANPGTLGTSGVPAAAPADAGAVATGTGAKASVGPAEPAGAGASGAPKDNSIKTASTGAQQPVAAGPASEVVTRKSVVKLGAVGTFSGPVGVPVRETVTGIRVWVQAVNAAGGINGHPIELLVGDDGGDPARFNSILQQFVEQQGVQVFLYNTLGFAPNGNNKYLDAKKIFTMAHESGLEIPYTNPYVLAPAPAGLTYADGIILAFGAGIGAKGDVKLASFACSDWSLCDNLDGRWSDKTVLQKAGFQLVARGRPSLTQPDYTSQCLAAKQAGAEAVILALDGASIRRFASACARQNYHPKLASNDLVFTEDLLHDKNLDGMVAAAKMAPYTDLSVPGIREMHAAFARFAPDTMITGGIAYGWLIGEFFAAAAKNLPDKPMQKDIEDGIYSIKNDNLKGMTYPITMTRGKPMARQLCYGVTMIKDGKYVTAPGKSFACVKDGKPMSSPNDYGAVSDSPAPAEVSGVARDRASPTRAALAASRPALPAVSRFTMTGPPAVLACPPARVTGLSYLLDALQTGSAAGPGVLYGIALAVLGTPLPEPLGQVQGQLLAESANFVEQMSKDAPKAIQDFRTVIEPLAAHNTQVNGLIDAGATTLDTIAGGYGTFIQPGDRSLQQLAAAFRDAKATDGLC